MYCSVCKTELPEKGTRYCSNCGTTLQKIESKYYSSKSEQSNITSLESNNQFKDQHSNPKLRNFKIWLFFGLISFGLMYIYYQKLTIRDMNNLEYRSTHDMSHIGPSGSYSTGFVNLTIRDVILFPNYFRTKFQKLDIHLRIVHKSTRTLIPSPKSVYYILIISAILIIPLFFTIPYYDSKFQKALNSHIIYHGL